VRIVLIGQAAFAERALVVLHEGGHEMAQVFAPPDAGGRPDPLKSRALDLRLPLSQPSSFRSEAVFEQVRASNADLAVLAFVTLIVPERVLYTPRFTSICFHPSLLPRHRGASAIAWTLIQGDTGTGVTWFWPDKGIDTGPILVQRRCAIGIDDTTGSLYFNKLFPLGIEALGDAIRLIEGGSPPRIPQDDSQATYEPICRDEHARVDFSHPGREVHNLIRGCDPQPGAYASFDARRLRLYEPSWSDEVQGAAPGTIISINGEGMKLALSGASIMVRRVRLEPGVKKVPPLELAESGDLKVGNTLV
jgi:methionyl-tRNA formyltransferase